MIPVASCSQAAYARIREALGPEVKLLGVGGSLGMTLSVETLHVGKARTVIAALIESEGLEAGLFPQGKGRKANKGSQDS